MQVTLFRGDKTVDTAEWTDALPQNMYGVVKPILGAQGYMVGYPGIKIDSVGAGLPGQDRGGIWLDRGSSNPLTGHYRVIGERLYLIVDTDGDIDTPNIIQSLGDIPGGGQCALSYSFNNLAIVSDGALYYFNDVDGVREITDPDVGDPIDITWGDNVFILTDGENIYHSDPLDEESYLPLDFGTAEFRPDPSLGVAFNEDSELIAFGTESIEHFTNVGGENFLFRRIKQKAQKIGITGTFAKGEYGNTYYMLGGRVNTQLGVYITESGASQKISSGAIDRLLRSYNQADLGQAIVEAVELDGSTLCLIHLPDKTLCFNNQMMSIAGLDGAWSELSSISSPDTASKIPHDAYNYVHDKYRGLWLAGHRRFNVVVRLDFRDGGQLGENQECILYSPLIKLEGMSIDSVEMEHVPGYGNNNISYTDPTLTTTFTSLTYDGIIYSKEWTREYGEAGRYSPRFIVNRLGYVRDFVGFKFRTHSMTRICFAFLDVEASV